MHTSFRIIDSLQPQPVLIPQQKSFIDSLIQTNILIGPRLMEESLLDHGIIQLQGLLNSFVSLDKIVIQKLILGNLDQEINSELIIVGLDVSK